MDTIYGGDGFDVVSYGASSAGVTVNLASGTGTGGHANGDSIAQVEGVVGSALADMLMGDSLDNLLDGAFGNDTLKGGQGADVFAFHAGDGDDQITDFQNGIDVVRLDSDLNGSGIENAGDALSSLTDDGQGNAVLDLGTYSVTFVGRMPLSSD